MFNMSRPFSRGSYSTGFSANWKNVKFIKAPPPFLATCSPTMELIWIPKKVSTVSHWPQPSTLQQLQSFLGFDNFFCCFIWDFSRVATPLTNLTRPVKFYDNFF